MTDFAWWQRGVIYQIYPRSFQDFDGDGTGDLRGIIARLDHLLWLGVDAIWISPVFVSPMADFGYDVSDYCDIDKLFGSLADMDHLIAEAHARGLKIILDYVPNHTSDQHPWFVASRDSRADARRDWYIWRDGAADDGAADGGPPNNWLANFGGPAWTRDERTGQYYLHSFLPEQPDLNWRNPAVRGAMFGVLRFWLGRGIDGFRVDVMWMLVKDAAFRDDPPNPEWRADGPSHDRLIPLYSTDRPETQELVAAMRAVLDEAGDRVLIGELYLPIERLMAYYGTHGQGAHLPFNFHLLLLPQWNAAALADLICRYEAALPPGAWPNWVLGNHDRSRIATRLGAAQARVAAILLLTLRGTPTIYMGEELGMTDTPIPAGELRDPAELREPGRGLGRDPQRTPFPWSTGVGAGFTTGTPWLRIGTDKPLSKQERDPASMVSLYRDLLRLRRDHASLSTGAIDAVASDGPVLRFRRSAGDEHIVVLANMGHDEASLVVPAGRIILSSHAARAHAEVSGTLTLEPDEAVIVRM